MAERRTPTKKNPSHSLRFLQTGMPLQMTQTFCPTVHRNYLNKRVATANWFLVVILKTDTEVSARGLPVGTIKKGNPSNRQHMIELLPSKHPEAAVLILRLLPFLILTPRPFPQLIFRFWNPALVPVLWTQNNYVCLSGHQKKTLAENMNWK